jgi:hypothetical protein
MLVSQLCIKRYLNNFRNLLHVFSLCGVLLLYMLDPRLYNISCRQKLHSPFTFMNQKKLTSRYQIMTRSIIIAITTIIVLGY